MQFVSKRKILTYGACLLFLAGMAQAAQALSMPMKAKLSVYLIENAWEQALAGDQDARPWPWMDSVPVARVAVPRLGKDMVVMRGVSGTVLAFAPGWHEGSVLPGAEGISLLAGHRDTHFSFMKDLKMGDRIELQTASGEAVSYEVSEMEMLDKPELSVRNLKGNDSILVLSTCYPFQQSIMDGTNRADMRFVVVARKVTETKDIVS